MVRTATARPVRAIRGDPVVADGWPWDVPAVRQFLTDGLEPGAVTILVGENGSGKSTLVEAIAVAYGLSAEGGSTGARHTTRPTESPLHERLSLVRNPGSARWGFFPRAETMHGFYSYLEANPGGPDPAFHEMSHGESFVAMLTARIGDPGFYVMDEPEAALSFTNTLALTYLLAGRHASGDRGDSLPDPRRAAGRRPLRTRPLGSAARGMVRTGPGRPVAPVPGRPGPVPARLNRRAAH